MNVSWFFLQMQKMTTSLLAHHHCFVFFLRCKRWRWASWLIIIFLFFFLGVEYDDKPLGSSSFFCFFLKCKRWRRAKRLIIIFFFFLRCSKWWWAKRLVVISWFFPSNVEDDNELGGFQFVVISWVFPLVQKRTTSLLAPCCLLIFFIKCKRRWWIKI